MNYDNTKSSLRENKRYTMIAPKITRKEIGDIIDDQKFKKEQEERNRTYAQLRNEEKGYTAQLLDLGKICRYIEHFDNIKLDEQSIMPVGPFENPRETQSFKRGYDFAQTFIDAGLTEENYHVNVAIYEQKYTNNNSKTK